jgi:Tfp pilus assembly protein PilF
VRPRVVVAVVLALATHATRADADWAVKRNSSRALEEQGERALAERPEDAGLAARLVRLAGKAGAGPLRARFEARAHATTARYADLAAYATLLAALGADEEAAAAFARAAAVRPERAMLAGRARALARAGQRAEALAAFDEAIARTSLPREKRRLLEDELALLRPPAELEHELTLRRALAALDPRSEDAADHVADVLERLGRPAEAADLLEARTPQDTATRFDRGLRVAALRDAAGDGARAATILDELLRALPRGDGERRRLAWMRAVAVARHRDALPALAAALARGAGPVEWDVLGQVRDELGDLEGALEAERRAAGAHPGPELGRRIIALLDRLGRDDETVAVYEDLARRAPTDPTWTLELVERELRRGLRKPADAHFDAAAARFSRSPSAMIRLAELAARWGEDARARAAWERARTLAPRDEQAILGLAETQFATGKRALALRTWQALRARAPSAVAGRLRLAEVLLEHDLLADALAEAQEARARTPDDPRVHHLLAQILERQRQTDAAVREWDRVVELSAGAGRQSERREARTRILTLLARTSRGRLDERARALEERVRRAPDDRETALFLAEAQQRLGNHAGAVATLRGILARDAAAAAGRAGTPHAAGAPTGRAGDDDANAEATLALVRLLRASGQTEEAVQLLEELATRAPARAREAHVQIADVELARHDETDALAHAEQAARLAPGDGEALARIAAIEERAGDEARAFDTYRRAFEEGGDATAGFALAAMLERRGDAPAAADVVHRLLETATDDDVILEAGRRAIELDEYLGHLPELERVVARGLYAGARAPVMRRVLVDVLRRLLPPLYRAGPTDAAASAARERLAQHGLRPLLELVADAEGRPDRPLVELLGMLGNKDAAPVLARLAAPATDPPHDEHGGPPPRGATEVQAAAVIALGRLGDERGHDVLEKLASAPDGRLRAAAVWALGRVAGLRDTALLTRALRDAHADVVGIACLGLGRTHATQATGALADVAADVWRPLPVRRAALAGLALTADRAAAAPVLALARSGDEALERSALLALGALRDPRTRPALLEAALLAPAPIGGEGGAALIALDLWTAGATLPDEATALDGSHVELDAALAGLEPRPSGAASPGLSREEARVARSLLAEELARPGARGARALAALDGRDDGIGLTPLIAGGARALPPATTAALAQLADETRDDVAARLDDDDPEVRARSLCVLAKTADARVTARRLLRAATGAPPERAAATSVARRWNATSPAAARGLAETLGAALPDAPDWDTRVGLVETLAALGAPAAAPLRRALDDRSALVRTSASRALQRLTSAGPPSPGP